jgi:hypothetical protein
MKPQSILVHGDPNKTLNILFLLKPIAKAYHLNQKEGIN